MLMKKISFIITMFFMLTVLSGTAPAKVDAEYDTGLKYYNSGKFEEAVRYLREYIQKSPDASAYYLTGYALYKLGKHDEAMKYFDGVYLIDPEFSPVQ
jgi:tetratricopeptide (TPR) repeat protein